MRNFKRTLALVLAVLVVVGTFATVSAAEKKWYQPGIDYIQSIGVDTITPAKAEQKITRNDFVLWIAKIESHQLSENAWKETVSGVDFTDVTDEHHKAAIAYSKQAKFIIGNGDGTFAPDKATTLGEASAVIVRVMGYEDKVYDTSSENWAYNYMRAAQAYCYAFNDTFLANTDQYNPDYELTYGEAAYLLATIMNASGIENESVTGTILTADGINLGDYFEGKTLGVAEYTYYVVDMPRYTEVINRANGSSMTMETNLLDLDSTPVVLKNVNGDEYLEMAAEDFLKYVRVAIGLPEQNDYMNEAAEISVFAEVPLGSMVTIKTDRQTGEILNFDITVGDTNSVVVDTYVRVTSLVAQAAKDSKTYAGVDNFSAKYLGWHTNAVVEKTEAAGMVPVLSTSYSEDLATAWTDLAYNQAGAVTSATLTFKGVEYVVGGKDATLEVLNSKYEVLSADEAVKTLINAAQGSVYAVFNDIDFDGKFDTVVVYKSDAFKFFSGVYNVDPSSESGASYGLYHEGAFITSISNGETIKDADGNEIIETAKQSPIGTIMINASVARPNEAMSSDTDPEDYLDDAWTSLCGDAWWGAKMNKIPSGKMQLVVVAPDGNGVLGTEDSNAMDSTGLNYNYVHPVYEVVDLAAFSTGIIEQIDAVTLEEYYIANIRSADGSLKTVYIPVTPEATATFNVTIGGATAEYVFDSSKWCTLLNEAEAAVKAGIVSGVDPDKTFDPETLTQKELHELTASWLAGKYVDFVVNEENVVIALFGTDKTTDIEGFVVNATTEGKEAENIYDVTIATSGTNNHTTAYSYITKVLASHIGGTVGAGDVRIVNTGWYNAINKGILYEDPNEPGTYLAKNGSTVVVDGVEYHTDSVGHRFIDASNVYRNSGVAGVKTVEVRASASSIFDWANYDVYSAIFAGKLLNPNYNKAGYNTTYNATTGVSEVQPGTDLIYVQVIEDGGSNYLQYVPYVGEVAEYQGSWKYNWTVNNDSQWRLRWYYPVVDKAYNTAMGNWTVVDDAHIIDIVEVDVLHEGMHELENGVCVCGTTDCTKIGLVNRVAVYNAVVGVEPYYVRSYNVDKEAYEYVIKYRTVYVYEGIIGTQEGIIDTTKTLMTELYYGGTGIATTQVKVTDETKDIYTLENGYFVDDNGYVYLLHASKEYENGYVVEFKKDKEGKFVYAEISYTSFEGQTPTVTLNDIALVNVDEAVEAATGLVDVAEVEATYETIEFVAKKSGDKGYYPGTAYFVVNGVKYSVAPNTPVVLVTPSANGFATKVYTVKQIVDQKIEFFATQYNATFDADNNMFGIALLGNVAGVKLGTDVVEDDEPIIAAEERVVYLNESAKAVIRAGLNDKGWMVISDESAIEIPSGESVGQIYRYYDTYAEAKKAAEIDITIGGGKYYLIDKDCEITGSSDITPKVGVIKDESASGKTMADMDIYDADETATDVSGLEFVWYYRDVDGNLVKADSNKNVNITTTEGMAKLLADLEKKVTDTKTVLDAKTEIFEAGNLSQTKYDYYKSEYEAAVAALEAAKAANYDKYYNGQFWGFANSPYYAYVQMGVGSFQQEASELYFEYIVVDDVYCVFSDTYTFTAPAK